MAEAFAILGIAANISQFVSFGLQLLREGKEAYQAVDGSRAGHRELALVINDIKALSEEAKETVTLSRSRASKDFRIIYPLAEQCEKLATRLLNLLEDLKVSDSSHFRWWDAGRKSWKAFLKKTEIEDIRSQLVQIEKRLRGRVSDMLRDQSQSDILAAIRSLDGKSQRYSTEMTSKIHQWRDQVLDLVKEQAAKNSRLTQGLDEVSSKLGALAEEAQKVQNQQAVLESLTFESMKEREETIKTAHANTLDWLFKDPDTLFVDWLENHNGIYWVKGKAGSGKSTLMKYVSAHDSTMASLQIWARNQRLVTGAHFFWNAGMRQQKSRTGLLQSLLYQVLVASPNLILELFPSRLATEPWTRDELFRAFQRLSNETSTQLSAKYCFFVDGLDEYQAEDGFDNSHEDIIKLLQELAACPNIKICVSSRPWNVFLDAFDETNHKLSLEALTKADMRRYVNELLGEDERFSQLSKKDPRCLDLVPQIVEKAQGVWLWVFLVVRDLLRDVRAEEDFEFLEQRLNDFPVELEKYFANILSRIDKVHRAETARIFLINVDSVRPLPVLAFKLLEQDTKDTGFIIRENLAAIDNEEAALMAKKWRKKLNSRCRDLLEVHWSDDCSSGGIPHMNYHVDFLHRTVRDFLRDNYRDVLRQRAGSDFNAFASLCRIHLGLIKATPTSARRESSFNPLIGMVDEIMYYARYLELQGEYCGVALLDEVDDAMNAHAAAWQVESHWTNVRRPAKPRKVFQDPGQSTYIALTIQSRLLQYVTDKLDANPGILKAKRGRPLLDYALRPKRVSPANLPYRVNFLESNVDIRIVRLLLDRGADPNEKIGVLMGQTTWELFLASCYLNLEAVPHVRESWFQAMIALIEGGADPLVRIDNSHIMNKGTGFVLLRDQFQVLSVSSIARAVFGDDMKDHVISLQAKVEEILLRRQGQPSFFWRMLGFT
ncbi:hypothetical protein BDV96DRAFT_590510 [Lophiotrema nucula]|uniref:Uncharacterized protein n=1 Tax=Lophiotrema nucula TaxID=690887 RepID=A0A6A5YIL6_9PLEO|nr:hypothetical protein BDV96DRAFT_590510 [Lophiotrema nucula]